MNESNNKNLILAIVFSALIIFGWNYFFMPKPRPVDPAAQATTTQQAVTPSANPAAQATAQAPLPREEVIAKTPRVNIETPYVTGSLNLIGAQLDDLHLNKYRETVSELSPLITLLSPSGTAHAYYAEQGLSPVAGSTVKLPNSKTLWSAPAGAKLTPETPLVLTWDNGEGVIFNREISISDGYLFTIKQTIHNNSANPVSVLPYGHVQREDLPKIEGQWTFYEGMIGFLDEKLQEVHYSDAVKQNAPIATDSNTGSWLGFTDKYWSTVAIPSQSIATSNHFLYTNQAGRDVFQADYKSRDPIVVQPGSAAAYQDQVFAGAKDVKLIQEVGETHKINRFDLMIDWGYLVFITKPMFYLLDLIKRIIVQIFGHISVDFGIAILVTTVLVKLLVFPLANKSYASMSKMKKIQPEVVKLKELYPDDKMKQQSEMMALYKREKVSPLSGCLPIFVQIPVFFALYKVIVTSIQLRHAPFYGWIHDLSAADPTNLFNLFGLINWMPPTALHIGVWPILMGITMWVQMRLNPEPPDPVQATMFNWMPVFFTYLMAAMPAGLIIYWTWSNFLSIIQQSYIMKRNGAEVDILGNIKKSLTKKKRKPSET